MWAPQKVPEVTYQQRLMQNLVQLKPTLFACMQAISDQNSCLRSWWPFSGAPGLFGTHAVGRGVAVGWVDQGEEG